MNKNYLIGGITIAIILAIAAYFQIQDNNKMYQELGINKNQNMEENQNTILPEGLKVEVLKEGTGQAAKDGDTLSVNYVGTLENGTKFDSSIDRGTPFSFELGAGKVIPGWDLGLVGMKVGEKIKLTVPPDLAYGPNDYHGIPGSSTLIFEVDLLGINQ
jgi:FKBP-type peptidyl-prolyl cis-trans isomerase